MLDFAEAQKTVGHLSADHIPDWRELDLTLSPAPLAKRQPRPSAKKKAAAAQHDNSFTQEIGGRTTPITFNDEDSATESVISTSQRIKKGRPNPANSISKRELQQSPSQPTQVPKKARLTTTQGTPSPRLDLSAYEFDEESKLDTTLIPRAAGVVSEPLGLLGRSATNRIIGLHPVCFQASDLRSSVALEHQDDHYSLCKLYVEQARLQLQGLRLRD